MSRSSITESSIPVELQHLLNDMQSVRGAGLEPARVSPYAPQTYASASFATRARAARRDAIYFFSEGAVSWPAVASGETGASGAAGGGEGWAGAAAPGGKTPLVTVCKPRRAER